MLREGPVASQLAAHVTNLYINAPEEVITASQFADMCRLHRVTHLRLDCEPEDHGAEGFLKAIGPQVSQLTTLCSLEASVMLNGDSRMAVSSELFELQALTRLSLYGFKGQLGTMCHLSNLQELQLGQGLDAIHVPADIRGLTSLTQLALDGVELEGELMGLSDLSNLKSLSLSADIDFCDMVVEAKRADFMSALGCLTALVSLAFSVDIELTTSSLGGLSNLTILELHSRAQHTLKCCSGWGALQHLCLSFCWLKCMPRCLSALTSLTQLDVSRQGGRRFQLLAPLDFLQHMPALRIVNLVQCDCWPRDHVAQHMWSTDSLFYLTVAEETNCRSSAHQKVKLLYLPS